MERREVAGVTTQEPSVCSLRYSSSTTLSLISARLRNLLRFDASHERNFEQSSPSAPRIASIRQLRCARAFVQLAGQTLDS